MPDDIRLTWSDDPKTTQTIGWRTDSTIATGKVEYAAVGKEASMMSVSSPERIATNVGTLHLFSATLRNLNPGTRYTYRVGDNDHWSPSYSFVTETLRPEKSEFIIFGDSHEKKPDYSIWKKTVTSAYQQTPNAKFAISLGDLIYSGKDYVQWHTWFDACKEVIAHIPFMPVIGDHEPRGVTSKDLFLRPEYFVKLFKVPQNGPTGFKGEVYAFDYGSVHIAVLNSSFNYEFEDSTARHAMIAAETAWLDADLASTTKRWKIVLYHDATYNLSPDRSGVLTKAHFGPIIDKHHVDAVFNAHDHAMARSFFMKNEEFVTSAAEGTVYFISGRSGNNAKGSLTHKVWHPFYFDPQAQTCYLAVSADDDELTVNTRLADGTIVDTFRINKTKPAESTPVVPFGKYSSARFAPFGSLIAFGASPEQNKAGEWFVDINALAAYLTGSFDRKLNMFSYDDDNIHVQLNDGMFLDSSKSMVSVKGLVAAGFYGGYHEAMNMIILERWRD